MTERIFLKTKEIRNFKIVENKECDFIKWKPKKTRLFGRIITQKEGFYFDGEYNSKLNNGTLIENATIFVNGKKWFFEPHIEINDNYKAFFQTKEDLEGSDLFNRLLFSTSFENVAFYNNQINERIYV